MNCRPGDLAVLIRSFNPENVGKLFEVIEAVPGMHAHWYVRPLSSLRIVCCSLTGEAAVYHPLLPLVCEDQRLRPLRDSDGPDQTLAWTPIPHPAQSDNAEASARSST